MLILNVGFSLQVSILLGVLFTGNAFAQNLEKPDLMSFANGTLPLGVTIGAKEFRVGSEHAIAAIDGNPSRFVAMQKPAPEDGIVEILYALPAPTTFDGFAVPNVKETPSPSQTFFKDIEILGSSNGPDGPFVTLAKGMLTTLTKDNPVTEFVTLSNAAQVGWVRLRLQGGIDVQREKSYFEFSELIGTGTQQESALSDGFRGVWAGRGVKLELEQDGATVSGCYDGNAMLTGTVQGRVLRALGENTAGILSQFILIATDEGAIRGLRSTNGAPFKPYDGDVSDKAPKCLAAEPPKLGCGSVVHGIQFDFDSDVIRSSSQTVLADLFEGLSQDGAKSIQIVGHSSSEGLEDYNRNLSERRAQSVVLALVGYGIDASTISAAGRGEDDPIASNSDEAGRSLNRRVEIQCTE